MTVSLLRALAAGAALSVACLALAACGGGDDSGGSTSSTTLSGIVANPIAAVPGGLAVGDTKKQDADNAEKAAGSTGVVRTLLSGATSGAYIDFIAFSSDSAAASYGKTFSSALPSGAARKFLPFLPNADCAEVNNGGTCGLAFGSLYVVTVSSAVDGQAGAGALESAVATYLGQPVDTTAGSNSPAATATRSTNTVSPTGACSLLTAGDAQTALNGAVGNVRQDLETCSYPGRTAGASVALELIAGGRSSFDNARSRTQGASNLTGVGDAAFVFASQAGFVQVSVVKGSTFFVVTVANDQDSQRQTRAVALAKTIASRVK